MKLDARRGDCQLPSLGELQALWQDAILNGDNTILDYIPSSVRASRDTLFGVYRNAYKARLAEILANDYPLTLRYSGHDAFHNLTIDFITQHPSRTQNARWFGAAFPEFIRNCDCVANPICLSEIAQIEKRVADAFDAADAPALAIDGLMVFPPEVWSRLCFIAHPSAASFTALTNAFAIWLALKDGDKSPEATQTSAGETIIVWRQQMTPRVRVLCYEEAMLWREATRGATFGMLCEMLATFDKPENAAARAVRYLKGWLASEMLTSAAPVICAV